MAPNNARAERNQTIALTSLTDYINVTAECTFLRWQEGQPACKKLAVAFLLVVMIWLELCTSHIASVVTVWEGVSVMFPLSWLHFMQNKLHIILSSNKPKMETFWYWLTRVHLEKRPSKWTENEWKTAKYT